MLGFFLVPVLLKLLVAVILGGLIGVERERSGHPAGFRTYGLISMGSAIFTILSVSGFGPGGGPDKVAAEIVIGIGFLGAGMIMHKSGGVYGLTTAAGAWVSAGVGMAVGVGQYFLALAAAIITMVLLFLNDNYFKGEIGGRKRED